MITPNIVSVQEKNNQTVNDAFPKRCSVKKRPLSQSVCVRSKSLTKKRLRKQSFFGRSSRNRTYTIGVRGLCAATTPCSIGETFFKFVKNIAQDNI